MFIIVILLLIAGLYFYLRRPQFTQPIVHPENSSAAHHDSKSINGVFQNSDPVPVMVREQNFFVGLFKFLFEKVEHSKPQQALPSVKTDLLTLDRKDNVMIWMGHSSYFIQLDGLRFLVDPVLSENASPVPYTNLAFRGSNIYQPDDIPDIDYLLITHDHWDHLDYPTVNALRHKISQIITPFGVGSYFRQWGFSAEKIFEGYWYDCFREQNIEIHILPAQHFSGRLLKRNKTLWGSIALISPNHKIYLGGDSGYGKHFAEISAKLGAFDIAVLETGQYNTAWPYIHMMPEETAQAAADLQSKALLPSHNCKFKLSKHTWYEPLERITQASEQQNYRLLLPLIGAGINLDDTTQTFTTWWRELSPVVEATEIQQPKVPDSGSTF
ncbi:MBL fold metallo-hydrolase [Vibrio mangrovi]|uniref:MBL fold metallo-hydrolase n=1 Tax=Vibrio mangrovi TaxID=474394 RepID=A0A1Y6IMT8_9VIBR|nr:MBL fold metallo-hydrolase [Vibrio mangrovi]MDW6004213.1 MBL fold metallo-hydrolase [Vibrio mangrovi]SMR98989.1 metal-dependent hydrolase [Vibrio mangrovi]